MHWKFVEVARCVAINLFSLGKEGVQGGFLIWCDSSVMENGEHLLWKQNISEKKIEKKMNCSLFGSKV